MGISADVVARVSRPGVRLLVGGLKRVDCDEFAHLVIFSPILFLEFESEPDLGKLVLEVEALSHGKPSQPQAWDREMPVCCPSCEPLGDVRFLLLDRDTGLEMMLNQLERISTCHMLEGSVRSLP